MSWLWVILGSAGLAALLYWQLIIAEGTYLGSRVVAWTYDRVARRYDAIKRFNPRDESWFVAGPLLRALAGVRRPLLLDVATGTGRLPLALLREHFRGQIVGLDLSQGMLRQARARLQPYGEQVSLVWQDASHLPFAAGTFDAVTCLESLEFLPHPAQAMAEMVRVLAPGGVLFLSNRVGGEAWLLPGRTFSRPLFEQILAAHPLQEVEVRPWQVHYDLALARKQGPPSPEGRGGVAVSGLLRCPTCSGPLQEQACALSCPACAQTFPIRNGVIHLARRTVPSPWGKGTIRPASSRPVEEMCQNTKNGMNYEDRRRW